MALPDTFLSDMSLSVKITLMSCHEQVYDIFSSGCDEAVVEYVTQDNNLSAIFFQDKQMRSAFEHYPEVILVDSTHDYDLHITCL
jgi:hypothetical protein